MTRAVAWRPPRARVRWLAAGAGAVGVALVFLAIVLRLLLPDVAPAPGDSRIGLADLVGFLGMPIVGALIASRLPGNPYGWLCCGLGASYGILFVYQVSGPAERLPDLMPPTGERFAFFAVLVLVVLVFLLFPTGRPPSRRWRGLPYAAVAVGISGMLASLFAPLRETPFPGGPFAQPGQAGEWWDAAHEGAVISLFALVLLAMLSVVPRFRRAGAVERQQLKWFVCAALVNAVALAIAALGLLGPRGWTIFNVTLALLPVAVGIAVLRYRLYEIDRIVSRTLSYGVLTTGLVALYFGVVTALRGLLDPVTGGSDLAVAGSTLAVAAAFRPARRRVQAAVDRRFDRTRYDAGRTVDAYARRLRASVDLDDVTAGLRETVAVTVGPERVSLWLRDRSGPPATASQG